MNTLRILLKYVAPYKWQAIKNILFNILSAFFALFTYTMVAPFLKLLFEKVTEVQDPGEFIFSIEYLIAFVKFHFYSFVGVHGIQTTLLLVCGVVVIASFLKNGFIYVANSNMAYIRAATVRDLRKKIYDKVLRLPLSYFSDARRGDVMTRVSNDVQEIELSVMSSLTVMFRDPINIIIFLGYLLATSLQLTLFALIMMPASGWLIGKASKTLKSVSFTGQESLGKLLSVVEESLTGLRIIKGFNAEARMQTQFSLANEKYARIFKKVTRKAYLASPLSEFLSTIVLLMILYFGASLALKGAGNMTPFELIAYIAVFSQIIVPAKNITTGYFMIQKGLGSLDRLNQILDADEKIVEKENAVAVKNFNNSIEFRNVWFAYNSEPVLKDISFTVKKGQTVAIVGRSGGGKSTLVDLIPRFMDVDKGSILIDGIDIRDLKIKDLRALMGIVSQQPILFNSTFRENIAFGLDDYPLEDVENAARIAHAHNFIMETELGYENIVGESGNKLSGGQKQRISIARAVMANPPVLILDEATSALDTESERFVQDAMEKLMKNRTSIVIAHRLSTIQDADFIIVLEEGKIVETGTHDELIKKEDGVYRKLYRFQAF
jgi:ATP-binding cassette, subfamily B, bacterial MsbA